MTELEAHVNELSCFLTLIENGNFSGKDSHKVSRLKEYLQQILIQLVDLQNKARLENEK